MKNHWKALSYTSKFSIIACLVCFVLGFLSMGLTGGLLYYTVFFVLGNFPHLDEIHGDWVWPAMLLISWLFPLGFIFGGLAWHYLKEKVESRILLVVIYVVTVWSWIAFLWYMTLLANNKVM
ncbi:hypothetical protein [Maribacter sp. 2210JD10-5]|uniref:hypothetical protein n=1 Tax=Maribacter sp. 2210JD10-5 TaxID=3386272 RepID=UPI0039BD3830